ncbi:MAG: phage tail assembly protein [Clostridiales bacterium]|nr:phage tail assembly protein [Clostridiales bacterium]
MTEILKLKKPIKINGETVTEIPYDFDLLTGEDICAIDRQRAVDGVMPAIVPKLDGYAHSAMFAQAVAKVNAHIAPEDLKRLSARDYMEAQQLARTFMLSDSEDGADATSDVQSPTLE